MGITTKTVTVCTCDLCGSACDQNDGEVRIQCHPGDGRDVGPGYIHGRIAVDLPYRASNGIVCRACKMRWLRAYVEGKSP